MTSAQNRWGTPRATVQLSFGAVGHSHHSLIWPCKQILDHPSFLTACIGFISFSTPLPFLIRNAQQDDGTQDPYDIPVCVCESHSVVSDSLRL